MVRNQAMKRHIRHHGWIILAATIGLVAHLAGCGSAATTSAPPLRDDGGVLGSATSTTSSPNPYQSFDPLNSGLPNDPNSLGGNFPTNSASPSASPLPGETLPAPTVSAAPVLPASPLPLPSWAPATPTTPGSGGTNMAQGGFGSSNLKSPQGLAVKNGKVYVADYGSLIISYGQVEMFNAADGKRLGSFEATTKTFLGIPTGFLPKTISGIAVGPNNIYVTDPSKGIYLYDISQKFQRNVVVSGITAIATSTSGNVYVAQSASVSQYDAQLNSITVNFTGGNAVNPQGVAVDNSENVYVADAGGRKVIKFDPSGQKVLEFDGRGTDGTGQPFGSVGGLGIDPRNGDIYVLDPSSGTIRRFDSQGNFKFSFGSLSAPKGIALDLDGTLYVSDNGTKSVQVFTAG